MRKAFLSIAMATSLCVPTAANAADAIYGVWVREGHPTDKMEFYDCSGKLCAKGIEAMPDGSPAPEVLRNAAKTAPKHWEGEIKDPESGKTYIGKISLDSSTALTMTGCLVAFLCQSETWTKVSGPTKPAADAKSSGHDAAESTAKPAAHEPAAKEAAKPAKASKSGKTKASAPAPKPE